MTRFRRSSHLVAFWEEQNRLRVLNYATGESAVVDSRALALLDRLGSWASREEISRANPDEDWRETVDWLIGMTLVESVLAEPLAAESAMQRWHRWNPAAGFFHRATRDVPYRPELRRIVVARERPAQLKSAISSRTIELPSYSKEGELIRVLLRRRSWRQFSPGSLDLGHVATLLGLTWGVQRWFHVNDDERLPLKTSPSGGARHSVEAYLVARRVEGLEPGTYHYAPDAHRLDRVAGVGDLSRFLPAQPWFHDAPAVFLMSSVFGRVQWRYDFARAYRVVLIELGHLGQTFCLLATSMGLAPFCTAALADSVIDDHLQINGIDESVLYATGVGCRPEGVEWAPYATVGATPETSAPQHARGSNDE